MLSCNMWFSAPSFWMDGGLESRWVGRVYGADVAVVKINLGVCCIGVEKQDCSSPMALELLMYVDEPSVIIVWACLDP